jgi:hypothetical protein
MTHLRIAWTVALVAIACGDGLESNPTLRDGGSAVRAANGGGAGAQLTDSAAGATPAANALWASGGQRLRPVFVTTDDGADDFVGWYDRHLDLRCEFTTASDGKQRCLPVPPQSGRYADATCKTPLLPADAECAHEYGFKLAGGYEVHRLGQPVAVTTIYERNVANVCVERRLSTPMMVFPLADEVAPTEFVARSGNVTVPDESSTRFDRVFAQAEDGSRELDSLFDHDFMSRCDLRKTRDGALRCVPFSSIAANTSDAACHGLVTLFASSSTEEDRRFGFVASYGQNCDVRESIHRVTTPHPGPVYSGDGNVCVEDAKYVDWIYYDVDPTPISDEAFEAFAPATETSRLRTRRMLGATGTSMRLPYNHAPSWSFTDSGRGDLTCAFQAVEGGELRCLPPPAPETVFADASCTERAFRVSPSSCPLLQALVSSDAGPWCKRRFAAFLLGNPVDRAFVKRNEDCVPAEVSSNSVFRTGSLVPAGQFVRGVVETR